MEEVDSEKGRNESDKVTLVKKEGWNRKCDWGSEREIEVYTSEGMTRRGSEKKMEETKYWIWAGPGKESNRKEQEKEWRARGH